MKDSASCDMTNAAHQLSFLGQQLSFQV